MVGFYDEIKDVVVDVMTEFNQGVIKYVALTAAGGPVDNPGEPTEVETTLVGATARTVSFKYVDGTVIFTTDIQVNHAVQSGVTPAIGDFVLIDGVRYKIIEPMNIPAAGTTVAHILIVRR